MANNKSVRTEPRAARLFEINVVRRGPVTSIVRQTKSFSVLPCWRGRFLRVLASLLHPLEVQSDHENKDPRLPHLQGPNLGTQSENQFDSRSKRERKINPDGGNSTRADWSDKWTRGF